MMLLWRKLPRISHTQILLLSLLFSYIIFILWLGLRLIVIISGAIIVTATIITWHRQQQPKKSSINNVNNLPNLLQQDIFLYHVNRAAQIAPEINQLDWQFTQEQSQAIHQIAVVIAQRESTLIPDLLDTLHTVLELIFQLVEALKVTQEVQTPYYQQLARKRLKVSQDRLHKTGQQLQELHDQILLEKLERKSLAINSGTATRLQILIADNKQGILEN